jgi:hypothetical protein
VYIDELLDRYKCSNVGCHIGHVFEGAFLYADDVNLLAPTKQALYKMFDIASRFGDEYNVKFNASKSKYLVFDSSNVQRNGSDQVTFGQKVIPETNTELHLGNLVGHQVMDKQIKTCISDFYVRVNTLIAQFGKANSNVKYKLLKSFCMSLYGCQLWDYSSKHINVFYTAWHKAIKRLFVIPYTTHNDLLHLICNDNPINVQLHLRVLKFITNSCQSRNTLVSLCIRLAMNGSGSHTGNSITQLCYQYKVSRDIIFQCKNKAIINQVTCKAVDSDENKALASVIIDLMSFRDNILTSPLNKPEIEQLLEYVCTS